MTQYMTRIKTLNQKHKLGVSNKTTVQYINCKTAKQKFDKVKSQQTTGVHCSTPTFTLGIFVPNIASSKCRTFFLNRAAFSGAW